jgi:predicted secreted hydrolase
MSDERSKTGSWKQYPFQLIPGDPELAFPQAEGDQGAESNTYYVSGRLRGRTSGREWAFLTIFTYNNVRRRLRADFFTLALFDLASGEYATFTEWDLPRPLRIRRRHKLSVERGALGVSFDSEVGESTWKARRAAQGELVPFAYDALLVGRDRAGRSMRLELTLETGKPPAPVGGEEYGGVKTCMGQYGTHSYFQSDVRFSGTLAWGDVREEVDGGSGWIDRQWTPRHLGTYSDRRSSTYRHEWRQIHLDNGFEMSVWMHYDRKRGNRLVPFSGATAAGPKGEVLATTEFQLERLSFVRDPGEVKPLYPLTRGARYFTDRYRLTVPGWRLDLFSEPLVPAPAHALPVEYWSGPTRLTGVMAGQPVSGIGFHERTFVLSRDFELLDVLRDTLRHLPERAFPAGAPGPLESANLAWEVDGFLSHGDRAGALRHLRIRVCPHLERLDASCREHVLRICEDLAAALH